MPRPSLHITLESELPRSVAVGAGTATFVCGWCFCPERRVRSLELILVGQSPQPVMAFGMPRLDPFRALCGELGASAPAGSSRGGAEDPQGHSYRSGFWAMLRIGPWAAPGRRELCLRACLDDGQECSARLGELELVERQTPPAVAGAQPAGAQAAARAATARPSRRRGPRVAICMATFNPPPELLERQLASIRGQTHEDWICLISDDCSGAGGRRALREAVGGDDRFVVSRSARRLGFYQNFERALTMVSSEVPLVALADQDDVWHPDKLSTLVAALGRSQLVYSDARVVSRTGETIAETWWARRRNNHTDLLSLLVANSVTGAASLFRRDLLDVALPFPPPQFAHFHDHWLALTALAIGDITFVDRPLYDYVQHGAASLGHAAANQMPSLRDRVMRRSDLAQRIRLWRMHYFVDLCRLLQFATVLQMRCAPTMTLPKRREVERFLCAEGSPAMWMRFALRGLRELSGTPETLGAEWMLLHALAWRRLVAVTARERPQARLRLDALPPSSLVAPPGRRGVQATAAAVQSKVAPLRWVVSPGAPRRLNVLIPTLDLRHLFAGYIGKFNLAQRLNDLGHRVRLVTVDPVGPLPRSYRRQIESYGGLSGLFDEVELVFGRESSGIEVAPDDRFVATTWWTAHVARDAMAQLDGGRFAYLIQEYEPFTFAMGSHAALAAESYTFPHIALFSSELLRDYFRRSAIGVYAHGPVTGDAMSRSFQNAITAVPAPTAADLERPGPRRLLFYARPEPHAARNMFEVGVLALVRAIADGGLTGWELDGIGTVGPEREIALGGGACIALLPRTDQAGYRRVLRRHDVGLSLMYTPHPSLVPIEMASAGMLTVTNTFENKTAEAMAAISSNLIAAEPGVGTLAAALGAAAAGANDIDRRIRGSDVKWSRDWRSSLPDDLLRWLVGAL